MVHYTYDETQIDYFMTFYGLQAYLIPVNEVSAREKRLRFTPPKNGQIKGITFATDYELEKVVNKINNSTVLYIGGGYGYLRDQIWKERRMELAFEWDRFWDIVRSGRAKECLADLANSRSNKRGLYFRKGVNEIFPIPQNEIDISNGIVTQNPGY